MRMFPANCQDMLPAALDTGNLVFQMKYLEEKTRIYENYRAIREDMFQKIRKNSIDSLVACKNRVLELNVLNTVLSSRIDSLGESLSASKNELREAVESKNSISVIGFKLGKTAYNAVTWTIILSLVFLLATGFLAFRKNRAVTIDTRSELQNLRAEFEEYRKKTRLEREKMSMDHFNEIRKLKKGEG
jgi:hypothetical protein